MKRPNFESKAVTVSLRKEVGLLSVRRIWPEDSKQCIPVVYTSIKCSNAAF